MTHFIFAQTALCGVVSLASVVRAKPAAIETFGHLHPEQYQQTDFGDGFEHHGDDRVRALIDLLTRRESPENHAQAARELGTLGAAAKPAIPALVRALRNREYQGGRTDPSLDIVK